MDGPARKSEPSIVTPRTFHAYLASRQNAPPSKLRIPSRLVLTYHTAMFRKARQRMRGRYVRWYHDKRLAVGRVNGAEVAVIQPHMGSAMAGTMLEEVIQFGARQVVEVGICGGLGPSLEVGDVIVVDEALVDEGTSEHYFEDPSKFSASRRTLKAVERSLTAAGVEYKVGGIWTTDAPYRETKAKLTKFQKLGALGVDMETSAMFAIATYRGVDIGSVQVVSDLVGKKDWKPAFHEKIVAARSEAVVKGALDALVPA